MMITPMIQGYRLNDYLLGIKPCPLEYIPLPTTTTIFPDSGLQPNLEYE